MQTININNINTITFINGLVSTIVQDSQTKTVLMFGYMSKESIAKTLETGNVTFFSRSKGRLWTKGETSKNYLKLVSIKSDCDGDALLVRANPVGPTCHTGSDTCWGETNEEFSSEYSFLTSLEEQGKKVDDGR